MIGDERLHQLDEPGGRTIGADALEADARALAQQEELVGETLGLGEAGIPAQIDDLVAMEPLVLGDDAARGMLRVGQLDGGIDEGAAALDPAQLEGGNVAQPGAQLSARVAGMSPRDRLPRRVEFARDLPQAGRDQLVLRREMAVELILLVAAASAIASTPTACRPWR